MPIDVYMSQLSPTMTEGKIVRWLKTEGSDLRSGEVMAEVETDKATMEIEVVDEGVLHRIIAVEGSVIAVGHPIAVIAEEGEDVPADYQAATSPDSSGKPSPVANDSPPETPTPTPTNTADISSTSSRIKATPLARRLAKAQGVHLSNIRGSGAGGRIVKADIELAAKAGIHLGTATATIPAPRPLPQGSLPYHEDEFERVENSMMRKAIARRLMESKQTAPHFYLNIDIAMDRLMDLRVQLNESADGAFKLSINDFILKAAAKSLIAIPAANASWTESHTLMHKHAHVSVAVAIDGGLITPVIRHADQKDIVEISAEVKELAARAREGKLKPEEYTGGTFSVSNLGMFGIKAFSAVVNPQEGAILAVGATEARAVVVDGALVIQQQMSVTLSCDHRVVDGAVGAQFLAAFKQQMECPAGLLIA